MYVIYNRAKNKFLHSIDRGTINLSNVAHVAMQFLTEDYANRYIDKKT